MKTRTIAAFILISMMSASSFGKEDPGVNVNIALTGLITTVRIYYDHGTKHKDFKPFSGGVHHYHLASITKTYMWREGYKYGPFYPTLYLPRNIDATDIKCDLYGCRY